MLNKLSSGLLFAVCLTMVACRPSGDKKNEDASGQNIGAPKVVSQATSSVLTMLESQFEKDSQNVELRSMLAVNYYAAGMLDKAVYHFQKVYERDNINLVALTNLGNIYYDTQQDNKAIEFYEKALAIDPANIDMRCDLATCYGRINRVKKAIEILQENIKMDPNHIKSHHNLSVWLRQSGDINRAVAEMNIYKKLSSEKK